MTYPKIVNNETSYYEIIVFLPTENRGKTQSTVYKTIQGARKKAFQLLDESPRKTVINIRKEVVYLRNENNELSVSSMIERIEKYHNTEG